MSVLKRVPLPISGVALGSASLGNLLAQYSDVAHVLFEITATVLLSLLVIKTVVYPETLTDDLKKPITAAPLSKAQKALIPYDTTIERTENKHKLK